MKCKVHEDFRLADKTILCTLIVIFCGMAGCLLLLRKM
jgi:hypothetical protein